MILLLALFSITSGFMRHIIVPGAIISLLLEYVLYRWETRRDLSRYSLKDVSKRSIREFENIANIGRLRTEDDIYPRLKGVERYCYMKRVCPVLTTMESTNLNSDNLVLDVGCGPGLIAKKLAELGFEVVGMDISEKNLKSLKHWCKGYDIHRVLGDAEALPFKDESLNTIIATETIEHLQNPSFAILEFARVTTPRGKILITTENATRLPYSFNPFTLLERIISVYYPIVLPARPQVIRHLETGRLFIHRDFTVYELKEMARSRGLTVRRTIWCSFYYAPLLLMLEKLSPVYGTAFADIFEQFMLRFAPLNQMGEHLFLELEYLDR